ncbi:unnamed protein product [Caenorhabditis angaria]|uniref:G-protein coupled receptors family 1 profile domain-containing protein n=1 Tax=Caenorhabditis angaria TaxID=860376 RepID=A0A9P1N446_9PELO|nr:unnamed protein product [Caenorhabditis angaria]
MKFILIRMYINFFHHYLPPMFATLSYIFNCIFIYVVLKFSRKTLGAYKYMLACFGVFDICYSTVDILVGMGSHSEKNTFCVFVSHGLFSDNLKTGFYALCVRCMFFSLSYGVLEIHFIYRYIALIKPRFIPIFSDKKWISLLVFLVFLQGFLWFIAVFEFLEADDEMRSFLEIPFRNDYSVDIYKLPMLGSTYWGASNWLILRSLLGIFVCTVISCFTIGFCCWVGWTIHSKLRTIEMSKTTKKMHRNLLTSLSIQTFIPFVISYLPCVVCWTLPMLHIDSKGINNSTAIIAVAAFPFIDPLAILLLLPEYRAALWNLLRFRNPAKFRAQIEPASETNRKSTAN